MTGFLGAFGPAAKALHIIFVVFWMAGLFIAGRYLVHLASELGGDAKAAIARWAPRFRLLRRVILLPSLVVTWALGLALAANLGFSGGWLHIKIALVLLLTFYQHLLARHATSMLAGGAPPARLRLLNEVPALFLVAIVFLVVLRPF